MTLVLYPVFNLLLLLILFCNRIEADDKAPDESPKINRKANWCENGSITSTTGECICSSHLGYHCDLRNPEASAERQTSGAEVDISKSCQFGFGISFFHNSCINCMCGLSDTWQERREAFRSNLKESVAKKGGKGKRGARTGPAAEETV